MIAIVEGLLLLASVRLQDAPQEPVEMLPVFVEAEARLLNLIETHSAIIKRPSNLPTITAYAPWIEEVWVNYLSNAIKYGGAPPHIEVGYTVQGNNMVTFWVQDNGAGLTPAEIGQLFIPFKRIRHAPHAEGHGLGLSIVHRIITKLGGDVGVESTTGRGSRFYFTLPLAP
jgi:signal transduction histidine kinase